MNQVPSYKYCIVPCCKSTTCTTPEKLFFCLPRDKIRRTVWFKKCRRDPLSETTKAVVCEDHFDLKEDLANYLQFKLGNFHPVLKPEAFPSIFKCQNKLIPRSDNGNRPSTLRRERQKIITQAFKDRPLLTNTPAAFNVQHYATSDTALTAVMLSTTQTPRAFTPTPINLPRSGLSGQPLLPEMPVTPETQSQPTANLETRAAPAAAVITTRLPITQTPCASTPTPIRLPSSCVSGRPLLPKKPVTPGTQSQLIANLEARAAPAVAVIPTRLPTTQASCTTSTPTPIRLPSSCVSGRPLLPKTPVTTETQSQPIANIETLAAPTAAGKAYLFVPKVNAPKRQYKCKATHVKCVQTCNVKTKDIACSPIKMRSPPPKKIKMKVSEVYSDSELSDISSRSEVDADRDTDWEPCSDDYADQEHLNQESMLQLTATRALIIKNPMRYIGVPPTCLFVTNMLAGNLRYKGSVLNKNDVISIVLRKIRLNKSYGIIGDCFGIDESTAGKLFRLHLPTVTYCLKQFVRWLSSDVINARLPLAFWARYRNVVVIIDTFEIRIQTPGDAQDQSETFSVYKGCNTIKYLIGISPDGTIMFISDGYLGRFSDLAITIDSGFLNLISKGQAVMADRGFKGLGAELEKRGSSLIRPPSVPSGTVLKKEESIVTKQIASLRIHVERAIRRVREFAMCEPSATLNHAFMCYADCVVHSACGLVNLQGPLVRI